MAELTGGILDSDVKNIDFEKLDYTYVDQCNDVNELKDILAVLKSGKEGIYPHVSRMTNF